MLAATLADGWWSGFVGFDARRRGAHYGSFPQLIAQLRIDYADGSGEWIATDDRWRTTAGPTRYADLLMGECLDATALPSGWDAPGFDDASWEPAVAIADALGAAPAAAGAAPAPPADGPRAERSRAAAAARRHARRALSAPSSGSPRARSRRLGAATHLVDFGQNIAGRVRLTVRDLPRGRRVTIRHGEALDDDGSLYTVNLRSAEATDVLIAPGGEQPFTFEPRFTFHGFRYAEVSGIERDLDPADVSAVVLHSDTPWAGSFDCSDPDLARPARAASPGASAATSSASRPTARGARRATRLARRRAGLPADRGAQRRRRRLLRQVAAGRARRAAARGRLPATSRRGWPASADEGAPGWADAGVLVRGTSTASPATARS